MLYVRMMGNMSIIISWKQSDSCIDSREVGGFKYGLDNTSINGKNGENHTSQEDKCKLVDIFDPYKDNYSHQSQAAGAVNTHVVQ